MSKDYIDTISALFIAYADTSELLKNYKYSYDTLSPSIDAYVADLDYDLIKNDTVKIICKYNELYKNAYRILIHNLRYKKTPRNSKYLSDNDFKLWNDLVDKINQIY